MGKKVGIIGAMPEEVAAIKAAMDVAQVRTIAGMEFCEGTLGGVAAVVVQCGIGKVNAAICAHTLVEAFGVTEVVNTGVAGSLDARIEIGDIVVCTDAVQYDYDVSPLGFRKGEILYTGLVGFAADAAMRARAVAAAQEVVPGIGVYEGRICSGDAFVTTVEQKEAITSEFGGLCCEMEGAAIAQTCYLDDTPFVVIRAISDKPDGSGAVDYETFKAQAAERCAAIVVRMVASA